tara:strand:- start:6 stop:515 length:510 start_codon:yes stop_codon:yes gene_type:complete
MEIFKDVPNYEGLYQVSDLGNVKSLARKVKCSTGLRNIQERILKPRINKGGYLELHLSKEGKTKNRTVHQLVAEAFLNHTPCGLKLIVNHINFIRHDNRAENLEIDTARNNTDKKHLKSSSEYVGVSWQKSSSKWRSYITINGKSKHLGYFTDELEAAYAYQTELNKLK